MNTQTPQQIYSLLLIQQPLLLPYVDFAKVVGCSVKTLRNKVSAGLFPRPVQTAFGPRFTADHLAAALTPIQPSSDPAPAPKKPGRPRIAHQMDKRRVR